MHSSDVQSRSRTTNMEIKGNESSSALFLGLSAVNLILTLGSLGFTCYSLHGFDSRLTSVEQDLLVVNHPDQFAKRVIVKPTSTHSPPSGSRRKEAVAKRAVDRPSMCRKCSSLCLNANRPRNVSCFSLWYSWCGQKNVILNIEDLFVWGAFFRLWKNCLIHCPC